MTLISYII